MTRADDFAVKSPDTLLAAELAPWERKVAGDDLPPMVEKAHAALDLQPDFGPDVFQLGLILRLVPTARC